MEKVTNVEMNVAEELLPRRYQEEIFRQAQQTNVIAALGTGSGKTFISTLLIKWVASKDSLRGKAVVFLVPKVTLVEQQGNFIANQTPLRVLKLHGSLDIDMADRTGWKRRFEHHDVFVMTAQIFLDLLTHSHWSINKVSLMVFDECHHTRKRHPFNSIMGEYFHTPADQRPKIFGMTASPISDPKDPVGSLATLEMNMDSKVMAVQECVEELLIHSPKPVEIVKEYPPPPLLYDYPSPSLWKCLNLFYQWSELGISWSNITTRYTATMDNLGPFCAEFYLYSEMKQHIAQLFDSLPIKAQGEESSTLQNGISSSSFTLLEIDSILSDFRPFFEDESIPAELPLSIDLEWWSPKVRVLVDILVDYHSPTFQGIVFVEQRQVAACLAKVLPCIPQIKGLFRCADLVGQASTEDGISKGVALKNQHNTVKSFRQGSINLLIATSVAEEGLDFPACDIVVRFDSLQHIVGYVQSRGRARNKTSTFIVMVQQDDAANLSRYQAFVKSEPELKRVCQTRQEPEQKPDHDEEDDPADLVERERYVVASTGAFLTYDNAISLLNYLCSLVPCDAFTPAHTPKYSGDFEATLQLPSTIPLPPEDLIYAGPRKHSTKEAKRAVAFLAVKALHSLNVFDDHLLPVASATTNDSDADARPICDISAVPKTLDVLVRDPWCIGTALFLHPVYIDGKCTAGIVTGTMLPDAELQCDGSNLVIRRGEHLILDECKEWREREMEEFTKLGIWYCITASPLRAPPSLFLIPLSNPHTPDYEAMERLLNHPFGNRDWSEIGEDEYNRLMIINSNLFGLPLLLRRIRYDLSPMSTPLPDSRESAFPTYRDYFLDRWSRTKGAPYVPTDGPLVEVQLLPRYSIGNYPLTEPLQDVGSTVPQSVTKVYLAPQGCCRWVALPEDMRRAFHLLPALCHRLTDIYRVRQARLELGLPPIADNLLAEAFTLPSANAGFNNQRLETLGDAVLKLCTTVHIWNKYPYRHEGQLSHLRQICVSNRNLLSRAKDIGLERFLTSEGQVVRSWRYTSSLSNESIPELRSIRHSHRQFPRRSLQDCMEATLGASFLTGGIFMAVRTGEALGLAFGGPHPWSLRYSRIPEASPVPSLFERLQENLGYTFHRSNLLLEAVTHPSFAASSLDPSYQRLEFLGDAVVDLVVTKYLFDRFPEAASFQLSWLRSLAVCSSALAFVAVRRLELHNVMLVNNAELSLAISQYVPFLESYSGEDIVRHGWKHDPPKAISDVLESILGAILVDSAYDFERVSSIAQYLMDDVLTALSPTLAINPISNLLEWMARSGCRDVHFQKSSSRPQSNKMDSIAVKVHENIIAGPVIATSLRVAKGLASERALAILKDDSSQNSLRRLCTCGKQMAVDQSGKEMIPGEKSDECPMVCDTADVVVEPHAPIDEIEEMHYDGFPEESGDTGRSS